MHVVWYDETNGTWGTDIEIMYANYTVAGWSNATAISDLYGWNNGNSYYPSVAVDGSSALHVVWEDFTDGEWENDVEIMYAKYDATGWSNATAISDLYGWNDGDSRAPRVTVDNDGKVHVVWYDYTEGKWGSDVEIMYVNYTADGWSNATAISDIYGWNDDFSRDPSVAVDSSGNVHVVWRDDTDTEWGSDAEIMYTKYTTAGWSNATVISDPYGWNNYGSYYPSVNVDGVGNVHVVWNDYTPGEWGFDSEVMHTVITEQPTSNHPGDITTTTSFSDAIYWKLYDESGRGQYRVWVNASNDNYYIWQDWTPWNNNSFITVSINRTVLGIFNYTIEYHDLYYQFGISDTVMVTILDYIPTPEEPIILAPQGGDTSTGLLSPLGLGIIISIVAALLFTIALFSRKINELNKKISKNSISKTLSRNLG
ncbi:MAG: hypothetical protein ACFFDN_05560 [Candidatus Hodarchaeota archaeon]